MENQLIKCTDAVVKIASRCNINCTYCYMYNHEDKSYLGQPKFMSKETYISFFKKVKIHCLKNNILKFHFILHGGEPLMVGVDYMKSFIKTAKYILEPEVESIFSIQTNGILINDEWCTFIKDYKIGIGISIDGVKSINDKYRIDHKGKGTYDKVIKSIKLLQKNKIGFGILSVINIEANPIDAYNHFKELGIEAVDFLLPDYTYDNLPPQISSPSLNRLDTPYADWLIRIFDVWFEDKYKLDIRLFKYSICLLLGGQVDFDYIGTSNNDVLVIETDGGIEPVDSLKICGNEFTKLNANIKNHSIDFGLSSPLSKMYHLSKKLVSQQCKVCPILEICGGGFLPHRYSKTNGFNNPSLYCTDLIKLFTHIQYKVISEFSQKQLSEFGDVELYSAEKVKNEITKGLENTKLLEYSEYLESFKIEENV